MGRNQDDQWPVGSADKTGPKRCCMHRRGPTASDIRDTVEPGWLGGVVGFVQAQSMIPEVWDRRLEKTQDQGHVVMVSAAQEAVPPSSPIWMGMP